MENKEAEFKFKKANEFIGLDYGRIEAKKVQLFIDILWELKELNNKIKSKGGKQK